MKHWPILIIFGMLH